MTVSPRALIISAVLVILALAAAAFFALRSHSTTASPAAPTPVMTAPTSSPCVNKQASPPCINDAGKLIGANGENLSPTTTATPTPAPLLASPADFTVTVKTLEKKCFGSAGCNVTYRIDPKTTTPCFPSCTVLYEIVGGEDVQNGSFTLTGTTARFDSQEMIQTKSSKAELKVKVTDVLPN
ncbi:hypothetical protein [Amycolatopsis sp. NPDC059657]|uniref:hypothetical protein n=1 Tax=Amycolatopsis sp. NPDC059657 TaxID=3346899 RepID=UPI003671FA45